MKLSSSVTALSMPENLAVNTMIKKHRERMAQGLETVDYAHFALGQSPFPVPKLIAEALQRAATDSAYGSAVGSDALTEAIIAFNRYHFQLDINPNRVVISNGTKMLIYMLLLMLEGHYIVPIPAWVGYLPMLDFIKRPYTRVRLQATDHYKLNLTELETILQEHPNPILILNNPHNPTGALYTPSELRAIASLCDRYQAVVIADEIYGLVTYDPARFHSMAAFYPKRTFVTQGLSKDRSSAGYRLGVCLLPTEGAMHVKERFAALASTLYTNVSTPIQQAAITAYQPHPEITHIMDQTRQIHHRVGSYVYETITAMGLPCSQPEGSFYVVIDFNPFKEKLRPYRYDTASALTKSLLDDPYRIAMVMGLAIGCDEDDLLARLAFVDYDGGEALKNFTEAEADDTLGERNFIKNYMPRLVSGLERLSDWVKRHIDP